MFKYLFIAIISVSFIACAAPPIEDEATAPMPVTPVPAALPSDTASNVNASTNTAVQLPSVNAVPGVPAPATSQAKPSSKATGALNPEHGKPGHRCDIPVGTPLSTPVQPMAQPAQPNQTAVQTMQPVPAQKTPSVGRKGKINPPHGEPGHDCAIAVGQPLN